MTKLLETLQIRLAEEESTFEAASPAARENVSVRLQRIRQMMVAEKMRLSEFSVPRPCECLR